MNIENDIQVSVCVVTYNQENYIAQCLESLVAQQTSFKFEIIVGEDCSTDDTRKIVQKYVEQYPDLVIPLFHEKNVGAVENIKQVYKKARGKYIAHLDGDDMALPTKLQRQFNILENYLDCNVCSHNVLKIDKYSESLRKFIEFPMGKYNLFDLYCKLPFFVHSSKMFRNKYDEVFWDDLLNSPYILDLDVHIANLKDGDIYHIGQVLGKYRVESGMTFQGGKVNPILPLGSIRVFELGRDFFKNNIEKLEKIEKYYAKAMLACAYEYAVNDGTETEIKYFINKSLSIKRIGIYQKFFSIGIYFPSCFIKILKLYSRIKKI